MLWSPLAEPRLNEHREMLACSRAVERGTVAFSALK